MYVGLIHDAGLSRISGPALPLDSVFLLARLQHCHFHTVQSPWCVYCVQSNVARDICWGIFLISVALILSGFILFIGESLYYYYLFLPQTVRHLCNNVDLIFFKIVFCTLQWNIEFVICSYWTTTNSCNVP